MIKQRLSNANPYDLEYSSFPVIGLTFIPRPSKNYSTPSKGFMNSLRLLRISLPYLGP